MPPVDPTKFSNNNSGITLPEKPLSNVFSEKKEPNGQLPGVQTKYLSDTPQYTPGSIASNPIGGGAGFSPGTLGQYTGGGQSLKFGMASNSLGISPSTESKPPAPQSGGFLNGAVQTVKNAYDGAVNGVASAIQPAVNKMMGVQDSTNALKHDTGVLATTMKAHPEHVTQSTIDSLATANRQIARAEGTPLPAGVPAQGNIVNAPVPQGMPQPVPMSSLPGAKEAAAPATDWLAKFKKDTGTNYDPNSKMDQLNMNRLKGMAPVGKGEDTTLNHAQYRAGQYSR